MDIIDLKFTYPLTKSDIYHHNPRVESVIPSLSAFIPNFQSCPTQPWPGGRLCNFLINQFAEGCVQTRKPLTTGVLCHDFTRSHLLNNYRFLSSVAAIHGFSGFVHIRQEVFSRLFTQQLSQMMCPKGSRSRSFCCPRGRFHQAAVPRLLHAAAEQVRHGSQMHQKVLRVPNGCLTDEML